MYLIPHVKSYAGAGFVLSGSLISRLKVLKVSPIKIFYAMMNKLMHHRR